ncbi:MAG TPA: biotin--[acetyl-CoA-carboxylase] ligase [Firmicutes bacterium]|nr:biotin--[acetyl-CoA-carboxylase] ligase [Bacillota bacterium]
MNGKDYVLKMLEEHKGESISGHLLAQTLGLSRTAIWKYIDQLRKEGYQIDAVRNKGYFLQTESDLLSKEGIGLYLKDKSLIPSIHVYKTIDSTNVLAKQLAVAGAPHGTLVISEEQTAGRGRLGRTFYSPANSGIYMSLILRPKESIQNALLITIAASVVVHLAIKKLTGIETKIKWVNDLYLQDKKVCGILTEAGSNFESGEVEYIVLGIGLNVRTALDAFPDDLKRIATSLFDPLNKSQTRNELVAEIMNEMLAVSEKLADRDYLKIYKASSNVLNQEIEIIRGSSKEVAKAIDIDEFGGLMVVTEDGFQKVLNSGEISIRRKSSDDSHGCG